MLRAAPAKVLVVHGEARAVAVAKFRELADRLESGELHGARVQWRDGLAVIEAVELGDDAVRFSQTVVE